MTGIFDDLAAGGRAAGDRLLGTCRLEWGGGEAYGEEAVLKSFRAAPIAINDGATFETAQSAAWVGKREALVADRYDGRIGRLWRLGDGRAPAREPAVAVAFDPDLTQQRGEISARAADHPDLDVAAFDAVIAAGRILLDPADGAPLHRSRAFVLRAFSCRGTTIALYALYRVGGGDVRTSSFTRAVAAIAPDGTVRTIVDQEPAPDWTPRL